jgi:hypothetical protein
LLAWGLLLPLSINLALPWYLASFDLKSFTVVNPGQRATVAEILFLAKNRDNAQYSALMNELDKADAVGTIADVLVIGSMTDSLAASTNFLRGERDSRPYSEARHFYRKRAALTVTNGVTKWIEPNKLTRYFLEERWDSYFGQARTPLERQLGNCAIAAGWLAGLLLVLAFFGALVGGLMGSKQTPPTKEEATAI